MEEEEHDRGVPRPPRGHGIANRRRRDPMEVDGNPRAGRDRPNAQLPRGLLAVVTEIPWPEISPFITEANLLGIGTFGRVYSAKIRKTDVAVKVLIDQNVPAQALANLNRETEIWRYCAVSVAAVYMRGEAFICESV